MVPTPSYRLIAKGKDEGLPNLYDRSIVEVDESGNTSADMAAQNNIHRFTGISLTQIDTMEFRDRSFLGVDLETPERNRRRNFVLKLRPEDRAGLYYPRTKYEMFGSKQEITEISLEIYPAEIQGDQEFIVSGRTSYQRDDGFGSVETPDFIHFYMGITTEKFDNYLWKLAHNQIGRATLTISGVDGFYSQWIPIGTPDVVKVLTQDHKVEGVDGLDMPVLRKVASAELTFSTEMTLPSSVVMSADDEDKYAAPRPPTHSPDVRRTAIRWPWKR